MQFLKDNELLFDNKKSSIIDKIENIFTIIESRSGEKKRKCPPCINDNTIKKVSN